MEWHCWKVSEGEGVKPDILLSLDHSQVHFSAMGVSPVLPVPHSAPSGEHSRGYTCY